MPTSNILILLRGYPGSGKSTIGKALQEKDVGAFIDHNKILNFIAEITVDDTGIYKEISSLEQAMTTKLLNEGKNVIVARGFSSQKSVDEYINIAKHIEVKYFIFKLNALESTLKKRVIADERKQGFNPTTDVKSLVKWVENNPFESIENENIIDAEKPIENIAKEIIDIINR